MKIFNRGSDSKPPAAAVPAGPAALAAPAPAPAAAPEPTQPAAPPAPDLAVILDANVKEMSEKIARLASSLESTSQERGTFEAKLDQMEERMRKLSSLTEMISAQYNPFVGDAPAEREALPNPEIGLAAPPEPLATQPASVPAGPSLSLEPPAPPEPFATLPPLPAEVQAEAPPAVLEAPPMAETDDAPALASQAHPLLARIAPGFESSIILLNWADMLLKSAGSRESLLELANYYHSIGWIGDAPRTQLLAYADGLGLAGPAEPAGDWRTNVDVHEKSLLYVEKLKAASMRR